MLKTRGRTRVILAAYVLVAVVAGAYALVDGSLHALWAAAAIMVVAGTVAVVLVVLASGRRAAQRMRRLEAALESHHQTAARWDWRLREEIVRTQPARPRTSTATAGALLAERAEALLETRVLDIDYYAAVIGREFESTTEAATHFLEAGLRNLERPSVLLNPRVLPPDVQAAMKRGDEAALLAYLRSERGVREALSECFFPAELPPSSDTLRRHPGGAAGWFASFAGDDEPLPIPPGRPNQGATWRDVRKTALDGATEHHAWERRRVAVRTSAAWDGAAEQAWLDGLLHGGEPLEAGLVDVIMPVLNRADRVLAAIASVQAQTYRGWRLTVVDDGSTDGTYDRVRAIAEDDPRIVVVKNPGSGVGAARNFGIDQGAAQFVAFLDSDNAWTPYYLEAMLRGMGRDGAEAAYSGAVLHGNSDRPAYRAFDGGLEHLLLFNHIDLNVFMVRRAVLEDLRFDDSLRRWVDHDFVLSVARRTQPVLLPFLGCEYDDARDDAGRITVRETEHWQWVVLGKHWVDWATAKSRPRVPGRVSIVIPTYNDSTMTLQAVETVLADPSATDVEIIVVDNGSNLKVAQELICGLGTGVKVRYTPLPRNFNFAIGCNYGASLASGEFLMLLNNDTEVRPGALGRLRTALDDHKTFAVQPLLIYPNYTVQTAGTVFVAPDAPPVHLLTGHPIADARALGELDLPALTAAALLVRTMDYLRLGGLDPIFVNGLEDVDLCLRARRAKEWKLRVVPDSLVTHFESRSPGRSANSLENRRLFVERWKGQMPEPDLDIYSAAGFAVAHLDSDFSPVPAARPILVREPNPRPRRWGIKIASVPAVSGDRWGDTHFADALSRSLEALGQQAVVFRHGAHDARSTAFDDVVLALRGLQPVAPMPGKVNVLWVISHPDMVSVDELRAFDTVVAASVPWAREMSARLGREVRPLLQATDPERFYAEEPPPYRRGAVFVGGAYGSRGRQVVTDALAAGVDLRVYGPNWNGLLPGGVHVGDYVPNAMLPGIYRGAAVVLADHWPDMARNGFVQNRLFDAVAAGCRVVSDSVDGVRDLFHGAVQTYRTPSELAELCASTDRFPSDVEMQEIARTVAREHSFAKRARDLVRFAAETHRAGSANWKEAP